MPLPFSYLREIWHLFGMWSSNNEVLHRFVHRAWAVIFLSPFLSSFLLVALGKSQAVGKFGITTARHAIAMRVIHVPKLI